MHPGIRIDKISIEGPMGFVFVVGMLADFLLELPEIRWFLALALPLGVVIGIILRFTSRD
jgi:hypothetical protein